MNESISKGINVYKYTIHLFTEKERFKNIYIDLSRQDKILLSSKNFERYPLCYANNKWQKIKKSTIKIIQFQQNIYLYGDFSIVKEKDNNVLTYVKEEYELANE